MANEAYFIRQRSLLHLPSKPASFAIEACCIFDTGFLFHHYLLHCAIAIMHDV